jgi:hypothetical protein
MIRTGTDRRVVEFQPQPQCGLDRNSLLGSQKRLYNFQRVPDGRRVRPVDIYPLRRLLPPLPKRKGPKRVPASALLAYGVRTRRMQYTSQ